MSGRERWGMGAGAENTARHLSPSFSTCEPAVDFKVNHGVDFRIDDRKLGQRRHGVDEGALAYERNLAAAFVRGRALVSLALKVGRLCERAQATDCERIDIVDLFVALGCEVDCVLEEIRCAS